MRSNRFVRGSLIYPTVFAAMTALLFLAAIPRAAAGDSPATQPATRPETQLMLDKVLEKITFEQDKFPDAVDDARDTTHANIVLDWQSLNAAGVKEDTKISLTARDIKLSDLLRQMLAAASDKADYKIDDDIIVLTSRDEAKIWDPASLCLEPAKPGSKESAALSQKLRKVILNTISLKQALARLGEATHQHIVLDDDAIDRAQVKHDTLFTVQLYNVTLEHNLTIMLQLVGEGKLGYRVTDGKILIVPVPEKPSPEATTRPGGK